ncbi:MAG: NmrA family NAD(P)-binding protein [Chitinispirillaceae bacterium]
MIVVTGASGKTGSKTAEWILENKENVRVIGRSAERLQSLAAKGAEIMTGDQADADFLGRAFSGATAVYLLIPPKMDVPDVRAYYNSMGDVAVTAIRKAKVKKVVFLSSLGAERSEGTGPVLGLHDVEEKLRALKEVDIVFLRPGYFMENTLMNAGLIKHQRINGNAASPDAPVLMVATRDIAAKAAELLTARSFKNHTVIELFGQRISYREATTIIGEKIGIPDLPYVQFSDGDTVKALTGMGLSTNMAASFVELARGISAGKITTTVIDPQRPNAPTDFRKFAEDVFVPVYKNTV